jgi:hypothetical protein
VFDWVDRVRDQILALPPEVIGAIAVAVLVAVVVASRRRW